MKVIAGLTISLSLFLGVTIADANCSGMLFNRKLWENILIFIDGFDFSLYKMLHYKRKSCGWHMRVRQIRRYDSKRKIQ